MRRDTVDRRALVLVSAWILALFIPLTAGAASPAGARPRPELGVRRTGPLSRGGSLEPRPGRLPDSILAAVGQRAITVSDFRSAWRETHPAGGSDRLTPEAARRFLEVLIDRELIEAAAARVPWAWTAEDSAAYAARADRLLLGAALDQVLAEARAAGGDSGADAQALGVAARERVMAELRPSYDAELVERVARAFAALPRPTSDSSLAAQLRMLSALPRFDPADTGRVLARTDAGGEYRVSELLRAWALLSPAVRPRIESAAQVRDLVANGLFERWLRRFAAGRGFASTPEVALALAREREQIAVRHLMARDVHGAIAVDTARVERWFRSHPADWRVPARYRVVRLLLSDKHAATRVALELRDAAAAESLVARALRSGARYRVELDAVGDSALFARASAAGAGAVTGPDPEGDGWSVMRVEALLPPRALGWPEARGEAIERWYAEQSAARLRALLERERRATPVRIRPDAFVAGAVGRLTEP